MRNLIKCCRVISIEAWFINYLRSDNFSTRVFFLWLIQTEFYLGAVIKSKKGNFCGHSDSFSKRVNKPILLKFINISSHDFIRQLSKLMMDIIKPFVTNNI